MNAEKGEALAAELGGAFCKVDIRSDAEVDAAFAHARAAHGQERILVNCAGVGNAFKTASRDRNTGEIRSFPAAAFDWVIQVNLVGTFRCIARSAAGMLTLEPGAFGERGAMICTASVAAEDGQIGQAAYSASKAGIVGMTLPIARDLSGEGIRINTILPGIFDTPMLATPARQRPRRAGRLGALPEAAGQPGGLCRAGDRDAAQPLSQRRGHPPRRGNPHGPR